MTFRERIKKLAVPLIIAVAYAVWAGYWMVSDFDNQLEFGDVFHFVLAIAVLINGIRLLASQDAYEESERNKEKETRIFKRMYGRFYRLQWYPPVVFALLDLILLRLLPREMFWITWVLLALFLIWCLIYAFFSVTDKK